MEITTKADEIQSQDLLNVKHEHYLSHHEVVWETLCSLIFLIKFCPDHLNLNPLLELE
jgi:hypothetical protein